MPSRCDPEIDYGECGGTFFPPFDDNPEPKSENNSNALYLMILMPMLAILFLCIALVFLLLIKRGKKNYSYGTGRSFSNPNYYSPNRGAIVMPTNVKGISKRLKFNKSQVNSHFGKLEIILRFKEFFCLVVLISQMFMTQYYFNKFIMF